MNKDDYNIHKDHRNRMRAKLKRCGADAFDAYQLIEMLLFHTIPRKDTNPPAHRLLELYPDGGLLRADEEEMTDVEGVGEKSAALLRLSRDTVLRLICDSLSKEPMESDFSRRAYLYVWFISKPAGCVGAMFLDSHDKLLECSLLSSGRMFRCENYIDKITDISRKCGAKKVILCHNHINGDKNPSMEDRFLTECISRNLTEAGLEYLGHYIVTASDCIYCPGCKIGGESAGCTQK